VHADPNRDADGDACPLRRLARDDHRHQRQRPYLRNGGQRCDCWALGE
jgi:hypothetical protein